MKRISLVIPLSLLILQIASSPLPAQQAPGEPPVSNARLETLSPAAGLQAALQQARSRGSEPLWVGYSVPMVAGQGRLCCFDKDFDAATCRLEGQNQGWGGNGHVPRRTDQRMNVLLRFAGGKLDEIRSFSEDCPLDAGGRRFVWLGNVKPEESVAYLADLVRTRQGGKDDPGAESIASLAMHRNAKADTALEELASARSPRKTREDALFWLGQMRGERGARFLAGVLRDDPDDDIREKAIFSLSQSEAPWAAETITRTGREDRSGKIRGEALFWLAQMNVPQAPDTILEAIEKDPDPSVRKHAVFALSQLGDGKSVPYLIRVGKETSQREIRKEAFFWLAQSDDPAALQYLDNALNEN
jgi:HEAT repeat protein